MKRRMIWALAGLLAITGVAMAQDSAPALQPTDQVDQPQERDRPGQRVRPDRMGPGMGGPGMMGRNLAQILNLTAEQQTQLQEIEQKARQERRQQAGERRERSFNREDFQKMRQMQDDLRAAAQEGDDAKVEKLQAQMRESSTMPGQFRRQQAQMYDQVEKILTDEQKPKFRQWRTLNEAGLPPHFMTNPQALQKAVMAIPTLSDLQKKQFDASFERYTRDAESPAATAESKQDAALKVASEVVAELKPSQKVLLMMAGRPQMGPGREGRPGRPPRDVGAPPGAPADDGDVPPPPPPPEP